MNTLQNWYASKCNGVWEKTNGVKIDTVAEGGWFIRVDLTLAEAESIRSNVELIAKSLDDCPDAWINVRVYDDAIVGGCAPLFLIELIECVEAALTTCMPEKSKLG